jgi:hypothetical protein
MRAKLLSAVVADQAAGLLASFDRRGRDLWACGFLLLGDFLLDLVKGPVLVVAQPIDGVLD